VKLDLQSISLTIGRGNAAAACQAFLRPELEQLKSSLFSQLANQGEESELLRLSGAALVVETLLGSMNSALDEGTAAQKELLGK
jgi:hypothetical protein